MSSDLSTLLQLASEQIASELTLPRALSALAACAGLYAFFGWLSFRLKYDWHKIPGTPVWPLIGDLPSFVRFGKGDAKVHEYLHHWWNKLGKPRVFKREFQGRNLFVIGDPDFIQRELTSHRGLPKSSTYDSLAASFGPSGAKNMFLRKTTSDEKWKAVRKSVAQVFSTENLKRTFPVVLDTADRLLKQVEKIPVGEAVEVREYMSYFTFEVISAWGLGIKTDAVETRKSALYDSHSRCQGEAFRDAANPFRKFAKKIPFSKVARETRENYKALYAALDDLIAKMELNDRDDFDDSEDLTIASCLLRARKSGGLTDDELRSEVTMFFFAGTDTTSQQITWILCCLAAHQRVQNKLAEELKEAGLTGKPQDLDYDVVRNLPYLNAVIKETLRLLPTAGVGGTRQLQKDSTVLGYKLPANTIMAWNIYSMNRNEDVYNEPDVFRPERWEGNELPNVQHDAKTGKRVLWSFSNGPRDCVGMRLAIMEMQIMLALLIGRFRVEMGEQMGGWEGAMARKYDKGVSTCKGGMWIKFFPRE